MREKLMASYLRDPRQSMFQKMIDEGSSYEPVKSPWQGAARLSQGLLGAYMAKKLKGEYDDKEQDAKQERSTAMQFAMGRPKETQQYGDTTINWNEQKPNFTAAAGALQSPYNEDLANTMFGAKINQDQTAGNQAFQLQRDQTGYDQAVKLAGMTADRQMAAQEAAYRRAVDLENLKNDSDPQKVLLKRILTAQGMQPQQPMQPMQGMQPQMAAEGLSNPLVDNMQPQQPMQGAQGMQPMQPQQLMQQPQQPPQLGSPTLGQLGVSSGGTDPLMTFALTGKVPDGYSFNAQGMPVRAENKKYLDATGESQAELADRIASLPQLYKTVDDLDELAEKATYTLAGRGANFAVEQMGFDPLEGSVARDEYISLISNQILPLLRQTFGAQFTQKEGESLKATLGDPAMPTKNKQAVLKSFIDQKQETIKTLQRRLGYPVQESFDGFKTKVKVRSPDGTIGRMDKSELEQALANGWSLVE